MNKSLLSKIACIVIVIILFVFILIPLLSYLKSSLLRVAITIPGSTISPFSLSHIEYLLGNKHSYHDDYSYLFDLKKDGNLYIIGGFRRSDNDLTKKFYIPLCKKTYKIKLDENEISEVSDIANQIISSENVIYDSFDVRYVYLLYKNKLVVATYADPNYENIYSIVNLLLSYYPHELELSFYGS